MSDYFPYRGPPTRLLRRGGGWVYPRRSARQQAQRRPPTPAELAAELADMILCALRWARRCRCVSCGWAPPMVSRSQLELAALADPEDTQLAYAHLLSFYSDLEDYYCPTCEPLHNRELLHITLEVIARPEP